MNIETPFPDHAYLDDLISHLQKQTTASSSSIELLMAFSGISMNWIADYITDQNVRWTKETLAVDDLLLTSTKPEWNKVILEQCERNPRKLRELMESSEVVRKMFSDVQYSEIPILIRFEDEHYKLLDGMHRAIAAVRDGKQSITAFVGRHTGKRAPLLEPHVLYDLMKAYHRGLNKDRDGLVSALRFLAKGYPNVQTLLEERFVRGWLPSDDLQGIIREALRSYPRSHHR